MSLPDYYRILGVSRTASPSELKAAYRSLALQYHPDLHPNNPQAEEVLKNINQAYDVLSDAQQRWQYDTHTVSPGYTPSTTWNASSRPATPPRPKSTWSYAGFRPRRQADSAGQFPKFHRKTVLAFWIVGLLVILFIGLWVGPLQSLRFGRLPAATAPRVKHQLEFVATVPYTRLWFVDVDGITYTRHAQVPKESFRAGQTLNISYTTSINAGRIFIGVKGNRLQAGSTAPFASGEWFERSGQSALKITIPTSDDYVVFLNLEQFVGSVKLNWAIQNP
ncbi:Chaperone protein DnaJ [Thermoflexales bacterium]|nr:Chaperone protein DnaJ [Thermoflexales bacterium]